MSQTESEEQNVIENELQPFDALQTKISVYVAPVMGMKVTSLEISEQAASTLRELKALETKVENERKELVGPLNDQVARINEYAKQVKAPIATAMAHVREQQLAYEQVMAEERRIQAEKERIEREKREQEARDLIEKQRIEAEEKARLIKEEAEMAAMFAPKEEAEEAIAAAAKKIQDIEAETHAEAQRIEFQSKQVHWGVSKQIKEHKVTGITKTWTYEVEDEALLPDEYWMVNPAAIKAKLSSVPAKDKGRLKIPGVRIFQKEDIRAR